MPSNQFIRQGGNILGRLEASDQFGFSLGAGDFNGDGRDDLAIGVPFEDIRLSTGGLQNDLPLEQPSQDTPVLNATSGSTVVNAGAVNLLYGSANGLSRSNDQFWHQGRTGILGTPNGSTSSEFNFADNFGRSVSVGDFDGDGFADLAVGVPGENTTRGAVNVLYGSVSGLTSLGNQLWSQDSAGIAGASQVGDNFGQSLTTGDFNGDGRDDLAIGAPGESLFVGGVDRLGAGAVNILYGGSNGLRASGDQIWHQNVSGVAGGVEANDRFGSALAAGDFNGDGEDDLAIGVPFEDIGNISDAGAVNILYGNSNGLTALGNQIWSQNSNNIAGGSEAFDHFGEALAVGDFDGDGRDDLAIGVPDEDIGGLVNAGAVNILYGTNSGLSHQRNQLWHQNNLGERSGTANANEHFGSSLAVGDFNGDGRDDLAIGTPEDIVDGGRRGAVNVIYGGNNGLTSIGDQIWHQNTQGIGGQAEVGDHFGFSLGVGDYNNDGFDDLAIGAPRDSISGLANAGAVNIIFGSAAGLIP